MQFRSNLPEGITGAVQWGVTGFFCFLAVFASVAWYLSSTRATYFIDGKPTALAFLLFMIIAGFLWALRNPDGHRKRVEVIIWLLILGFVLPMLLNITFQILGLTDTVVPFSVIQIVAYALTVLVAYGLVYGLDLVIFLPDESQPVSEG